VTTVDYYGYLGPEQLTDDKRRESSRRALIRAGADVEDGDSDKVTTEEMKCQQSTST
jgi:hypothetical protein